MLLKATHAPFIGGIWAYERWETLALSRAAAERAALSFVPFNTATNNKQQQQQQQQQQANTKYKGPQADGKSTTTSVAAPNKKHSLKKAVGKVHVPTALLSQASKRPSKQSGAPVQDTGLRINTAPAAVGRTGTVQNPVASVPAGQAQPVVSGTVGAAVAQPSLGTADVAEMMRMLKELSAQVEEVRAALVKHDQGPSE